MAEKIHASDSEALLREGQAAEFLCLSVRTLQAWRVRGIGPRYCAAGRAVRYRRRDLIAWIEANMVYSTSTRLDVDQRARSR